MDTESRLGAIARDIGIRRVSGKYPEHVRQGVKAAAMFAAVVRAFDNDDILLSVEDKLGKGKENRWMGAVARRIVSLGIAEPDGTVPSRRKEHNRYPVTVWRSLILD